MATSSLTFHLTVEGPIGELAEVAAALAGWLQSPLAAPGFPAAELDEEAVTRAIAALWPRLSPLRQRLLHAAAERPPDEMFTLRQLADEVHEPYEVVRSSLNSLPRSLSALRRAIPGAPADLFAKSWNSELAQQGLQLVPDVRAAILAIGA